VTVSIGVAAWPSERVRDPLSELMNEADAALLKAKAQGRDLVLVAGV
jgi:GGDEF domain-containing protein